MPDVLSTTEIPASKITLPLSEFIQTVKLFQYVGIHMKFVVTGGAGFIGSHLVRRLVSDGHDVTVIDNLVRGQLANLSDVLENIHFEKVDIRNREEIRVVLEGAEGIFHQAALGSVQESWKDPDLYQSVNINGTRNIIQMASRLRIKVVYASSASVYGDVRSIPISEDAERRPMNPYGKTKLDCEVLAEEYMENGTNVIGLRYFNVFGTGQNPNYAGVISKFLGRLGKGEPPVIFGDGQQVRDFASVQDVVSANILAMSSGNESGFFNIGGGRPVSLNYLASIMIALSGKDVDVIHDSPRPGDPKASTANIDKAAKILGWVPKISLEEGLRTLFQDSRNTIPLGKSL